MSRVLLFVLLLYIISSRVSTESCIIQDKKGDPDIRVIELDDFSSSTDSSEMEILELHLPDRRRRQVDDQEIIRSSHCRKDDDCGPGRICIAHLACLKGRLRTEKSPESVPKIETRT